MSNYYYPQNSPNQYTSSSNHQAWNNWPLNTSGLTPEQSAAYGYTSGYYDPTAKLAYDARNYANANNPQRYSQQVPHQNIDSHDLYRQSRYHSNQFANNNQQSNWQQQRRNNNSRKRSRHDSSSPRKPSENLSKKSKTYANDPKIIWDREDAINALKVEREYNSKLKNHSLIIKFPDPDLNKDVVKEFHPAIENVHFQQASTPRFCHVTLDPNSDTTIVKNSLNRQKFGEGYLAVELKKDKEEEQDVSPDDIDPYTLYVDNISSEASEETIRDKYPKTIRINIGYAQKMKNSRYAFVRFNTVEDSIAAFKDTHKADMFSRNLKVRFRRLHGNVGMPGETKHQNPPKSLNPSEQTPVRDNLSQISAEKVNFPPCKDDVTAEEGEEEESKEIVQRGIEIDVSCVKNEPESEESLDEDYWQKMSASENSATAAANPAVKIEPDVKVKAEPQPAYETDESSDSEVDTGNVKQEPVDADVLSKQIKVESNDGDASSDDEYETLNYDKALKDQ